jgi:hypothetical protein
MHAAKTILIHISLLVATLIHTSTATNAFSGPGGPNREQGKHEPSDPVRLGSSALTQIINDRDQPVSVRRTCIVQLFDRHVRAGMPLSRLLPILKLFRGLRDDDVFVIQTLAGNIPVDLTHEDTVFCCLVMPRESDLDSRGVYVRVKGNVSRDVLLAGLHGEKINAKVCCTPILEIGF